jgi:hypothetical protein
LKGTVPPRHLPEKSLTKNKRVAREARRAVDDFEETPGRSIRFFPGKRERPSAKPKE